MNDYRTAPKPGVHKVIKVATSAAAAIENAITALAEGKVDPPKLAGLISALGERSQGATKPPATWRG